MLKTYLRWTVVSILLSMLAWVGCGPGGDGSSLESPGASVVSGDSAASARAIEAGRLLNDWSVGDRWSRRVTMDSHMLLPIGIRNADTKETELVLDYEVVGDTSEGGKAVEVTIRSIKASMISLKKRFSYDSDAGADESEDAVDSQGQRFQRYFKPLVGATYTAALSPDGSVSLTAVSSPLQSASQGRVSGTFGGDQAAMVFGAHSLKKYLITDAQTGAADGTMIQPGDQWQGTDTVLVPLCGPVTVEKTYSLAELAATTEQVTAPAVSVTFQTRDPNEGLTEIKGGYSRRDMDIVGVRGEGTVFMDRNNGELVRYEEVFKAQVQTKRSGAPKNPRNKIFYLVNITVESVQADGSGD